MEPYFAVFKIRGSVVGATASYSANGVADAMQKMCTIAKQQSTNDFTEYEIYEVIGDRKYKPVASRLPSMHRPQKSNATPVESKQETPAQAKERTLVQYPIRGI